MSNLETHTQAEPTTGASSAPQFAAASQPSYFHTLFLGPDGLRPGCGFAFYTVSFFLLQRLTSDFAWSLDLGFSGLWSMLIEEVGNVASAVVPAVILSRVEGRSWGSYGLPGSRAFGRLFWAGLLWGFSAISVLMLTLNRLHCFAFGHPALHAARAFRFALFWAMMFLLVGFFEEFLLRGYSQFTLARGIGFWPAAIALSCAFGLIHLRNGGEQWSGLLAAAVIGFFFCLTLRRTGNLWFAVGFHAAWDWGETYFYSVPDSGTLFPGHLFQSSLRGPSWLSGGSVGPEGSVLCFAVILLAGIAFDRTYRPMPASRA
jgi:membrane protease YdiL (CAAX protease family)